MTTHRTDETKLTRELAELIIQNQSLPKWTPGDNGHWIALRSRDWNKVAKRFCLKHRITDNLIFHKLCDMAHQLNEL